MATVRQIGRKGFVLAMAARALSGKILGKSALDARGPSTSGADVVPGPS
jgi:hypothetical protein